MATLGFVNDRNSFLTASPFFPNGTLGYFSAIENPLPSGAEPSGVRKVLLITREADDTYDWEAWSYAVDVGWVLQDSDGNISYAEMVGIIESDVHSFPVGKFNQVDEADLIALKAYLNA